jgi:hypothetical protein
VSLENLEQDLAAYRALLDDIDSGRLTLQQGEEEIVADLKRRIQFLEERLGDGASSTDPSADGETGFAT